MGWYTDSKYKNQISVIEKGLEGSLIFICKMDKGNQSFGEKLHHWIIKGTKANTITVSATVSNYVKSSDGYYYLVYVDSNSGKVKNGG